MEQKRCPHCMSPAFEGNYCVFCGQELNVPNGPGQLRVHTLLQSRYQVGRCTGDNYWHKNYVAWDLLFEKKVTVREFCPIYFASRGSENPNILESRSEEYAAYREEFKLDALHRMQIGPVPHTEQILGVFEENNTIYLVLEYLEGETLEKRKRVSPSWLMSMLLPVMQALQRLHHMGILHGDICPKNILLTPGGDAVLTDFGKATYHWGLEMGPSSKALPILYYSPLEYLRAQSKLSPASDVYAMCATIYECITGNRMVPAMARFMGEAELDFMAIPLGFSLKKGLELRAEDRFQSMGELIKDLEGTKPVHAPSPNPILYRTEEASLQDPRTVLPGQMESGHGSMPEKPQAEMAGQEFHVWKQGNQLPNTMPVGGAGNPGQQSQWKNPTVPVQPFYGDNPVTLPYTMPVGSGASQPPQNVGCTVPLEGDPSQNMGYTIPLDREQSSVPPAPVQEKQSSNVQEKTAAAEMSSQQKKTNKPVDIKRAALFASIGVAVVVVLVLLISFMGKNKTFRPEERVLAAHFAEQAIFNDLGEDWKTKIHMVTFVDSLKDAPKDAVDVSQLGNGSVLAWIQKEKGKNHLYIGAKDGAYAPDDCSGLFRGFTGLECADLSSDLHTENAVDMSGMFAGCGNLTEAIVNALNVSRVEDMSDMFRDCISLDYLAAYSWKLDSLEDATGMFYNTPAMTNVDMPIALEKVARCEDFMDPGGKLRMEPWESYLPRGQNQLSKTFLEMGIELYGVCNKEQVTDITFLDTVKDAPEDASQSQNKKVLAWVEETAQGYHAYVAAEGGVYAPDVCAKLFDRFWQLERVNFNGAFHTEYCKSLEFLFYDVDSLRQVDFTGVDTRSCTTMQAMFHGCVNLEKLDLSGFNTANVTDMGHMFQGCESLTNLDLGSFDTRNVKKMYAMLYGCSRLTSLNLSSFDTGSCTDFGFMLSGTPGLKNVEGSFDFSRAEITENFMDSGDTFNGQRWESLFQ